MRIQKRAAREGFDWTAVEPVLRKVVEEVEELRVEIERSGNTERIEGELGDLLFTVVNLARHRRIDAETALRRASSKFERRFRLPDTVDGTKADADYKDGVLTVSVPKSEEKKPKTISIR